MPFYCWSCEACASHDKTFEYKMEPKAPVCSHCEQTMERDYPAEHSRHTPASGFPYTTSNITGSPVEVTSLGHEKELCRIHGVTKRDDQAWLSKEHAGLDWRTGKPIYREESGMGFKGTWI